MEKTIHNPGSKQNVHYYWAYQRLRICIHLLNGETEEAREALRKWRHSLEKQPDETAAFYQTYICPQLDIVLQSLDGAYDDSWIPFLCAESCDQINTVINRYLLGRLHRQRGQEAEAAACFTYVCEQGRDLYVARLAQAALSPPPGPAPES